MQGMKRVANTSCCDQKMSTDALHDMFTLQRVAHANACVLLLSSLPITEASTAFAYGWTTAVH